MIKDGAYSSEELKALSFEQLNKLAEEIRRKIIDAVFLNGGHLSSNLGVVEATIALHRSFDFPSDTLVFDVGHQCYAHKILTGRGADFSSLRQYGGISGFPNREESEYDAFTAGHAGSSLSIALGVAKANAAQGRDNYAVAFVGDGSFSNGMIFEALNNCTDKNLKLIIVLNDNGMSISRSVGGVNDHLTRIRTSKRYFKIKNGTKNFLSKIPFLYAFGRKIKNFLKRLLVKPNLFEDLGLKYIGPIDGNDLEKTCSVLEEAKKRKGCCVVHLVTKKGMGCDESEKKPDLYHAVGIGRNSDGDNFSAEFGKYMIKKAEEDDRVCAITAAMTDGTGLKEFSERFPGRFFDTGIAEEHAVSFAAGLSYRGFKPVFAVYSTFAQRIYDQIAQDAAIQKLDFILAEDRCGIVPGDGITHQGIFDYAILTAVPGVTIYSPYSYGEMRSCFDAAFSSGGVCVVRYPKGREEKYVCGDCISDGCDAEYARGTENKKKVVITYGKISARAFNVCEKIADGERPGFIRLVKIYPLDFGKLKQLTASAEKIIVIEESYKEGSLAQKLALGLNKNICQVAINDFVGHGDRDSLLAENGFSEKDLLKKISE